MLKPNNQDRHWTILESEYLIRRPWLTARKYWRVNTSSAARG